MDPKVIDVEVIDAEVISSAKTGLFQRFVDAAKGMVDPLINVVKGIGDKIGSAFGSVGKSVGNVVNGNPDEILMVDNGKGAMEQANLGQRLGRAAGQVGQFATEQKDKLVEWGNTNPELRNIALVGTALAAVGGTAYAMNRRQSQNNAAAPDQTQAQPQNTRNLRTDWGQQIRAEEAAASRGGALALTGA